MKKAFLISLLVSFLLLSACNGEGDQSDTITTTVETTTAETTTAETTTVETTTAETTTAETTTAETTTAETTTAETTTESPYIPRYFEGEYDERELHLSDFENITPGMPLWQLYELVGLPDGAWGTAWVRPYYRLADGSDVVLYMNWYNDDSEIVYWAHFANDGTRTEFNPYGLVCFYEGEYYERELYLSDFEGITGGMPMWQVLELVGPPVGWWSNLIRPYYRLTDGSLVTLGASWHSDDSPVWYYYHDGTDGSRTMFDLTPSDFDPTFG